jgi:pimeloyl-ACP methyl ester carboxylesterase
MQAKLLNDNSDHDLFARQIGTGEPVLIVHGLLGSSDNWTTVARDLARFYTVFSLDLRNHGRSFHSDHFDYPVMAEDVKRFIQQFDLKNISLMGHSMGGKVAMQFAYLYPERLRKLVVVDIAPRAIPDTSERLSHLKNLKRGENGTYHWQVNLDTIRRNYQFISGAVTDGTYREASLFVRGVNSDYIQDADWDEVLECFPLAQLKTIPNAGHWVHIQARQLFVKTVLDYLAA